MLRFSGWNALSVIWMNWTQNLDVTTVILWRRFSRNPILYLAWIDKGSHKPNQWRFWSFSWRKERICCSVFVESDRSRLQAPAVRHYFSCFLLNIETVHCIGRSDSCKHSRHCSSTFFQISLNIKLAGCDGGRNNNTKLSILAPFDGVHANGFMGSLQSVHCHVSSLAGWIGYKCFPWDKAQL